MTGRITDQDGRSLIVSDSHTAANTFGFGGPALEGLRNVPKSRFMFYARFQRARSQGQEQAPWERDLGFAVKSIDRPRVSFETQTLSQYGRKRVVQTKSEFEPVMFRFHDTVQEKVQEMFRHYYSYYYGDNDAFKRTGSQNALITADMDPAGPYGFKARGGTGHFFNKVTVYQLFNKYVSTFELINPKIQQFNPDEMDYASNNTHEIVLTLAYEGIVYTGISPLNDSPWALDLLGIDRSNHYEIDNQTVNLALPNMGDVPEFAEDNTVDGVNTILRRQFSNLLTGQDFSLSTIGQDFLSSFDRGRGLSTIRLGTGAVDDLVNGRIGSAARTVGTLLGGGPGFPF